jgi:hypothetical protein
MRCRGGRELDGSTSRWCGSSFGDFGQPRPPVSKEAGRVSVFLTRLSTHIRSPDLHTSLCMLENFLRSTFQAMNPWWKMARAHGHQKRALILIRDQARRRRVNSSARIDGKDEHIDAQSRSLCHSKSIKSTSAAVLRSRAKVQACLQTLHCGHRKL